MKNLHFQFLYFQTMPQLVIRVSEEKKSYAENNLDEQIYDAQIVVPQIPAVPGVTPRTYINNHILGTFLRYSDRRVPVRLNQSVTLQLKILVFLFTEDKAAVVGNPTLVQRQLIGAGS